MNINKSELLSGQPASAHEWDGAIGAPIMKTGFNPVGECVPDAKNNSIIERR